MNIRFLVHRLINQTQFGYAGILEVVNLGRKNKMSMQMLTNKTNPHSKTHSYDLDFYEMILDTINGHAAVAEYHAQKANGVFVELPPDDEVVGDMSLLEAFMQACIAAGDFAQEFQNALQDNRITPLEMEKMRKKMHAHIALQLGVLAKLEEVVE